MRIRLRAAPGIFATHGPHSLFCGLAVSLVLVGLSASCVASPRLIQDVWNEAVLRSGYPPEKIRQPEIIEPPKVMQRTALPRDENNQPVVAQYFPLSHQVRIYSRLAVPMKQILLREFLYAIYYDRLSFLPVDVQTLSEMDTAQEWVEQALNHPLSPEN
jgi:hypothetical protein